MKELITIEQANRLMLALIVVAPILGALWGLAVRKVRTGALAGLAIGVGNFAMWHIYNAITNNLGLDTVKNLVINLGMFICLGILIGSCVAWYMIRKQEAAK